MSAPIQLYKTWIRFDSNFKNDMTTIRDCIIANGSVYLDGHEHDTAKELKRIYVCHEYRNGYGWIFPGNPEYCGEQCKNALEVYGGKLYLSTCSKGISLDSENQKELTNNGITVQQGYGDSEITVSLSVDEFLQFTPKSDST